MTYTSSLVWIDVHFEHGVDRSDAEEEAVGDKMAVPPVEPIESPPRTNVR